MRPKQNGFVPNADSWDQVSIQWTIPLWGGGQESSVTIYPQEFWWSKAIFNNCTTDFLHLV
jgi:hypothetical protein